ncbi:YhcN/YlaJ family sporulation lipoprotein [Paenibacillus sp. NEAU-GSW1]|uniref:YhcN/YlaJ family sporulation lipoprotein n=1 Tax=Paenibacillus sp. NEAU-GSW1 TaxID=2682486 RepID=UPI001565452A|nr:YhcN/YlaJ family sporulation lipoprotein [Paenibacillus sp. NEAU-GSW1]
MRKMLLGAAACIAVTTMLSGCASNQGDLGNRNIRPNSARYDANGNIIPGTGVGTYNNYTGNNYTAKRFANDQLNEMNRVDGMRLNNNNIVGSHKNYKMEMSQDIANRLANKNNIKSAYVLLTDNNAYVAVSFADHFNGANGRLNSRTNMNNATHKKFSTMSTGDQALTAQVKEDIAREVKRMNPSVNNVYVSANPDFVTRMNSYMNDVKLGHPIQGFIAEFNAMAERLFPANAAKNDNRTIYDSNR